MTGCHPQEGGLSDNMKKDAEDMARIDDQSDQSRMVEDAGDKAVAGDDEIQEMMQEQQE